MEYQKYIELGFQRIDLNDEIEFKQTGYYGFSLEKEINDKITIVATYYELDKPEMYIKKRDSDLCHVIKITTEMVIDLIQNNNKN